MSLSASCGSVSARRRRTAGSGTEEEFDCLQTLGGRQAASGALLLQRKAVNLGQQGRHRTAWTGARVQARAHEKGASALTQLPITPTSRRPFVLNSVRRFKTTLQRSKLTKRSASGGEGGRARGDRGAFPCPIHALRGPYRRLLRSARIPSRRNHREALSGWGHDEYSGDRGRGVDAARSLQADSVDSLVRWMLWPSDHDLLELDSKHADGRSSGRRRDWTSRGR